MKSILKPSENFTHQHPQILFEMILENIIQSRKYYQKPDYKNFRILLVPTDHYIYTGMHLAAGYETLFQNTQISKLIIVGMKRNISHDIIIPEETHIALPMGTYTIDQEIVKIIKTHPNQSVNSNLIAQSASIHYQLPYIRSLHPITHITPIVVKSSVGKEQPIIDLFQKILDTMPEVGIIFCGNLREDETYPESVTHDHKLLTQLFTNYYLSNKLYEDTTTLNIFAQLAKGHQGTITPLLYMNSSQVDGNIKKSKGYATIIA